jgi:hypothetical protein
MPIRLSRYFGGTADQLQSRGVFNAFLGIDNKLFVDPNLLKQNLKIPEFANSREDLTAYFSEVIKLLEASKKEGDIAWQEAYQRLRFKEENGAALGYSNAGGFGRAVGPTIARVLVKRAKEIIQLGIKDPEFFELIGLFQEEIGADLLSDMAISILKPRFLQYSQRITKELNLKAIQQVVVDSRSRKTTIGCGRQIRETPHYQDLRLQSFSGNHPRQLSP